MAERLICIQEVIGSTPIWSTIFAVVSQLVESEFSKLDVAGSIPVYRTNFGGNAEWWRVNPSPLEKFSHPLKTAAGPTRCSWCSQGADESRGEIYILGSIYGRGIVVVQQSPKLPYESSILSVRAKFDQ